MSTLVCMLLTSLMTPFFTVSDPVVMMRENPSQDSEVVSEALFSETVQLEKEENGWSFIQTPDQCRGWVNSSSLTKRNAPYDAERKISRLAAHVYKNKEVQYGPLITLPYGVKLHELDSKDERWIKISLPDERECFIQIGDVKEEKKLSNKKDLVAFSKTFLGLPYTWGGRSSFGYDCSGFVQMLYQQIDIILPRNSRNQINETCFRTIDMDQMEGGDLIFFGKSDNDIRHVAMYIGDREFIHASSRENNPYLRISSLSDEAWKAKSTIYPYRTFKQLIINPLKQEN